MSRPMFHYGPSVIGSSPDSFKQLAPYVAEIRKTGMSAVVSLGRFKPVDLSGSETVIVPHSAIFPSDASADKKPVVVVVAPMINGERTERMAAVAHVHNMDETQKRTVQNFVLGWPYVRRQDHSPIPVDVYFADLPAISSVRAYADDSVTKQTSKTQRKCS